MGYTHYWRFLPYISKEAYEQALTDIRKIVKASPVPLANGDGKGRPTLDNKIRFNGRGENAYEDFLLNAEPNHQGADFCKTSCKPYDVVVTACLCVLAERVGHKVLVSSDGLPHEWEAGKSLASAVLGREVPIPSGVLCLDSFREDYRAEYLKAHPEYTLED